MGCCVTNKDKGDKLEMTISNIFVNNPNAEFVDISLNSDDGFNDQKMKDWQIYKYSARKHSEDSFEIMSTFQQSEKKHISHSKSESIIDSFCSSLSQTVLNK